MLPVFTSKQCAEMLGVTPATIQRRYKAGELKGYKIGRSVRIYIDQFQNILGPDKYAEMLGSMGMDREQAEPPKIEKEEESVDSLL